MPRKKPIAAHSLISGTSLVELLVVIVVFLIGILAIVQIFPGGIRILAQTKDETIANTLAHRELDRVRVFQNSLPEQIESIYYPNNGTPNSLSVGIAVDRSSDDLGPFGQDTIQLVPHTAAPSSGQNPFNAGYAAWNGGSNAPIGGGVPTWDLYDSSGDDLGPVPYGLGANNVNRVIGEGRVVPAPVHVGNSYGALLPLEFGPAVWHASSTSGTSLAVYGNDLDKIEAAPTGTIVNASGTTVSAPVDGGYVYPGYSVSSYQYYLDDSNPSDPFLYIPVTDVTIAHTFKLTLVANIVLTGGAIVQRTFLVLPNITATIPASPPAVGGMYFVCELNKTSPPPYIPLNSGETLSSVDFDTVRLARVFDQVTYGNPWNTNRNADGTPQNPYQYMLTDIDPTNTDAKRDTLGMLLINPLAYGYVEQTKNGQSILLQARVDYDVFDWRILKEDFKAPDTSPYQYQLSVGNLKHHYGYEPDGTLFLGMGFETPNEDGTAWDFEKRDVVVVDLATGGVITKAALGGFEVNYSIGMLRFNPVNPVSSPTTPCLYEVMPSTNGGGTPVAVPISGLTLRVYYMSNGEWSTQLLKSAANYQIVTSPTAVLMPGQIYLAGPSSLLGTNGDPTIHFPTSDVGATVTFDELWYDASNSSAPEVMNGQSFIVKPADFHHATAYIALTDIDPYATGADFSNNYAVRGVKGLSLSVRVLWNPGFMTFDGSNVAGNVSTVLNQWGRGWRHVTTEGVLQRGSIEE